MLFVYFISTVILVFTKLGFVLGNKKSVPVNIALFSFVIFLLAQVASTFTSMDKFTSVFGFPSRLNGGLLSQFAYLIIFAGVLINLNKKKVKKLLVAGVLSAFVVALWGIPAHFGKDPNCLILTGSLNSACWQKDFDPTLRIFSTLGQPNWLASYLILILPIALSLIFTFKQTGTKLIFLTISQTLFLAFIFTNSRSGALGLVASLVIFLLLLGKGTIKNNSGWLASSFVFFISLTVIFGTTLSSRIKEAVNQKPVNPIQNTQSANAQNSAPKGPTESGQIRIIVWKGALNVIKNNPILGTGPETFAYSYYQNRPLAHNQTTEWNFFYNKAHNELLNIFANTGILGVSSFLLFLTTALYSLYKGAKSQTEQTSGILTKAAIAAIVGFQISIFFGFSTVASQTTMFLILPFALILGGQNKMRGVSLNFLEKPFRIGAGILIMAVGLYLAVFVLRLYLADIFITRAKDLKIENPQALLVYSNAISTSPVENPFYLADTANSIALYAQNASDEEIAKSLEVQAGLIAERARKSSPANILTARKLANTYILLSGINDDFKNKAEEEGNLIVKLAPTDPQSYVSLAKVQISIGKENDAQNSLKKALDLKKDYAEAEYLLEQVKATNYNKPENE